MSKIWLVRMVRMYQYDYTSGAHSSFADSAWESKEDAIKYLDTITDGYDETRHIWYIEYKDDCGYQLDLYEISPVEFTPSEDMKRKFHLEHAGGRTWKDFELGAHVQHMFYKRKLKTSEEMHVCIDTDGELCIVGTGGESYWFTEDNPDMKIIWDN